ARLLGLVLGALGRVIEELETKEDRRRQNDSNDHVAGFVGTRAAGPKLLHRHYVLSVGFGRRFGRGGDAPVAEGAAKSARSLISAFLTSSSKADHAADGVSCRATKT